MGEGGAGGTGGAGDVAVGAASQGADQAGERRSFLGPLNSAALRRLLITGAFVNIALSATEVALTAYVRQRHALPFRSRVPAQLNGWQRKKHNRIVVRQAERVDETRGQE